MFVYEDQKICHQELLPSKNHTLHVLKTSDATNKQSQREVLKNSQITAWQFKQAHPDLLGDITVHTIQKHCQKHLGLPLRSPTVVSILTHHICCAWLDKVMWSDKSIFQCVSNDTSSYLHTKVKHPDSITAWYAFRGAMGCMRCQVTQQ